MKIVISYVMPAQEGVHAATRAKSQTPFRNVNNHFVNENFAVLSQYMLTFAAPTVFPST